MKSENLQLEHGLTVAALALVVGGCLFVLAPFTSVLLWAVIVTFSTWALFERVLAALGGRGTLAALVMTLLLSTVLVLPVVLVAAKLGDNLRNLTAAAETMLAHGVPAAPAWVGKLPLVGPRLFDAWQEAHAADAAAPGGSEVMTWLQDQAAPATRWLLARGLAFGQALLQVTLVVLVAFFLYRDGIVLAERFRAGVERLAGQRARGLVDLAGRTVKGVVYGIIGTALVQGILAGFGFAVAGVPGPLVLGMLVFVLSPIPLGPVMVWLPATLWLVHQEETGWAIFMFAWGLGVVSSIDNVLRPYLISQGSALPFVLVLLGVIGGLLAFGFVGVFLGPTLLAVGYAILREWTYRKPSHEKPPE